MLPGLRTTDTQYRFLPPSDQPLTGHGQCRVILGDFCEELAVKILSSRKYHAFRFRTDSRATYCPDIGIKRRLPGCEYGLIKHFLEVKSVGLTNATFIYEGRLKKDANFAQSHSLSYLLFHHTASVNLCRSADELRALFLSKLQAIYLLPLSSILDAAATVPITDLNSKYGHSHTNPTYGQGRRLPLLLLLAYEHVKIEVRQAWELF